MKDRKIWQIIISCIFAVSVAALLISVALLGMLPNTYLAVIGAVVLIISALLLKGLLSKKQGKGKIVIAVIACILSLACIAGTVAVSSMLSFFNEITAEDLKTGDYYVVVREDSKYKVIEDIQGEVVSVLDLKDEMHGAAKEALCENVKVSFETTGTLQETAEALIEKDTDVLFLGSPYYEMALEESKKFTKDNTRILDTIHVEMKQKTEKKAKQLDITKDAFNVYVSGIDTDGSITNVSRSDVNMIMTINPVKRKILLTSIPRDYHVVLSSFGAYDKLTHSGIYGIDETTSTIEDLLGIKIHHYVKVNFTTVRKLVDALGGIEVISEYDFSAGPGYHYNQGSNFLNGDEALYFARERYSFSSGDNQRVKNQQAVISGILNKATSSPAILTQYNSILAALEDNLAISLSQKEMSSLVKMQLEDMRGWDIETISLTGSGSYAETYSMPGMELYVMEPNQASIEAAKKAIAGVMSGKTE